MSPLDNLQQQLYDERRGSRTRYFVACRAPPSRPAWEVTMWTMSEDNGSSNPRVWAGLGDAGDDIRASEIADAVRAGMLSVQGRGHDGLKLLVHVDKGPVSVYLDPADKGGDDYRELLRAAYNLIDRPENASESSQRAHAAHIAQLEAEITSLQSRNANLTAKLQRLTGSSGRKDVQPTVKPVAPPANASVLQPNQRRRKVEEDEFMGSDDDDDDDDDDSEEDYEED